MIAQSTMDIPVTPGIQADDVDVDPADIVDSLDEVISDINRFLDGWFQRLSRHLDASPKTAKPDERLRRRIQEFEQEKLRWDAKRHAEELRIGEKAQQLTEAWLRLEAEQRRFLQIKETHPGSHGHRAATVDLGGESVRGSAAAEDTDVAENDQVIRSGRSVVPSPAPARPHPTEGSRSREAAVQQFEQLRREIESSRLGPSKL